MKGIYTGEIYRARNQTINNFINSIKQQSESFRTFLIKFAIDEFNNKIKNIKKKEDFYDTFRNYFLNKFKEINLDKNFKELKKNKLYELSNQEIIDIVDEILPTTITEVNLPTLPKKKGTGLKQTEKQISKKYFIDKNKLDNNILEVRYNKNRHLTGIKTQIIGSGVKSILNQIIDHDKMDQTEYDDLTDNERHLIRTILNMLEKSHLIKNQDQDFHERFQILLGSYNAGNNSEILKSQLKQYIIHAMKLNLIPRNVGHQMLLELSL
jgi:hypothetical protein